MKTAEQEDWNTKSLPTKRSTIHLERTFSSQEMKHMELRK